MQQLYAKWKRHLVVYLASTCFLVFSSLTYLRLPIYLPKGSLQMYPVLKSHGASFQRNPKPAHVSSHRSAARNEEHLPSPDGSIGPHRFTLLSKTLPSIKTQVMDSPVQQVTRDGLITCRNACCLCVLLVTWPSCRK